MGTDNKSIATFSTFLTLISEKHNQSCRRHGETGNLNDNKRKIRLQRQEVRTNQKLFCLTLCNYVNFNRLLIRLKTLMLCGKPIILIYIGLFNWWPGSYIHPAGDFRLVCQIFESLFLALELLAQGPPEQFS